ncbi:GNAT family N-acetyltransferase [Sedimenticola sp.]|uniref:GNAT family N-acetyltransferase n=1 Tax=Sedimenticola sp. TaxID=1940285 RepID=UPI003D0D602C
MSFVNVLIREAQQADGSAIVELLNQLGYPGTDGFIEERLEELMKHPDARVLVAVDGSTVIGVLSLNFIPQLALAGDFCRISYLCVRSDRAGQGVGGRLEAEAEALARLRGCDRMEVHCHSRRTAAHLFYGHRGYQEIPKYLVKSLR